MYIILLPANDSYAVTASASGYETETNSSVNVPKPDQTQGPPNPIPVNFSLVKTTSTVLPLLVSSIAPNSRNAQVNSAVTIFMTVINSGTVTATNVSITQASSLPANIQYRQWNGTAFIAPLNTPVDMSPGDIANFVVGIDPTSAFATSLLTLNASSANGATAPISGVNTLTMSASLTPVADVIMMATGTLNYSTAVDVPTAFAVATMNVGTVAATGVKLVVNIPSSITGLTVQVNQTNQTTGAIIGPATGLTIAPGDTPTFAVFLTPTQPITLDYVNHRIMLELVDSTGKIIGAQSVAVSTT
jgi:uncharacterized repeat protein (TIGR01451 family)